MEQGAKYVFHDNGAGMENKSFCHGNETGMEII